VGFYIWYSEEGPGRAAAPPSLLLAVPNVTAHPSTASVPITVLLFDGPLLCGFNVAIKGLRTIKTAEQRTIVQQTVIGTLAVDGWAATFGTARRGFGGAPVRPGPSSLYQV